MTGWANNLFDVRAEGWLTPPEAGELRELTCDKVVLEIGAWLGLSTITIANVAKHLVSVDHHRGSPEHQQGGPCYDPTLEDVNIPDGDLLRSRIDTLPRFMSNLQRNCKGGRDGISVVVARIEQIGPLLRDAAFDVVFIDGEHSTEAATRDGELALRVVRPGGWVAFHDYNWDTVRAATATLELGVPHRLVGTLASFRR